MSVLFLSSWGVRSDINVVMRYRWRRTLAQILIFPSSVVFFFFLSGAQCTVPVVAQHDRNEQNRHELLQRLVSWCVLLLQPILRVLCFSKPHKSPGYKQNSLLAASSHVDLILLKWTRLGLLNNLNYAGTGYIFLIVCQLCLKKKKKMSAGLGIDAGVNTCNDGWTSGRCMYLGSYRAEEVLWFSWWLISAPLFFQRGGGGDIWRSLRSRRIYFWSSAAKQVIPNFCTLSSVLTKFPYSFVKH